MAIKEEPIETTMRTGIQHHQAGRLAEAESAYRRVLERQPRHFDAVYLLGVLAHQAGSSFAAADLIRYAISLNPRHAEAHAKLGVVLALQGNFESAIESFQQAVALYPQFAEAHTNLGASLAALEKYELAVESYRKAIALRPRYPEAYSNLGVALRELGRPEEAIAAYRQSIAQKPGQATVYSNLGSVLTEQGQIDEAVALFELAIQCAPSSAEPYANLGRARNEQGEFEQAIAASQKAIFLRPDYASAHWNLALSLLCKGELAQGFAEYEWRFRHGDNIRKYASLPQPQWRGEPVRGRTVLLRSEQGFGDMIQFVRYVPLVAERGAKVILEANPELHRLLAYMPGAQQVVRHGNPLPAFDLQCPVMSLPAAFGTTLDTIPRDVPYLTADPALSAGWRGAFAENAGKVKVGLSWSGNPNHSNDRNRSLRLLELRPLQAIAHSAFYSLQKGAGAAQAAEVGNDWPIVDLTGRLADFADTAAMLSHLDLVITVDTAVAHLAGAMGKPVWLLLPFVAEWRWMIGREDSPWYPTLRLFRQSAPGQWGDVVERVARELARYTHRA